MIDALETLRVPDFTMNYMTETEYIKIPDLVLIQDDDLINLLSAIYPDMLSSENVVDLDSSESDQISDSYVYQFSCC